MKTLGILRNTVSSVHNFLRHPSVFTTFGAKEPVVLVIVNFKLTKYWDKMRDEFAKINQINIFY